MKEEGRPGTNGRNVDELLAQDVFPPPLEFFEKANPGLDTTAVPKTVMISPKYLAREKRLLWKRVWQVACRERALPNIGDYTTYEILDQSLIILRSGEQEYRAFHNVCQHRGVRLVTEPGSLGPNAEGRFRCPFHGWCYDKDGKLKTLPRAWDFPGVEVGEVGLPPVKVDSWDGWIFVNLDPDAEPLADFIGETISRHFTLWPQRNRHLVSHAAKIIRCNWKTAIEAFLEVYHVATTHPSSSVFANDIATRYDQFGRHGRMHMVKFVAPNGISEQSLVDRWIGMGLAMGKDDIPQVPEGGRARGVLANYQRQQLSTRTGVSFARYSDAEMLDTLEYFVFPNFMPWGGFGTNLVYRARPHGDDPNACFFEVMITAPDPAGEKPADAAMITLPEGTSWLEAPGMSGLGGVLDEDVANLERQQLGFHSDGLTSMNFGRYQESTLRHLHATLEAFMAPDEA